MSHRAPPQALVARVLTTVAAFLLLPLTASGEGCMPKADEPHYAETMGWQFNNPTICPQPWTTYRDSYLGIPPTHDLASSALDVLFYDLVYKKVLFEDGTCFGMSLQSLLMKKNGAHLGFCAPVSQYSGDLVTKKGPTNPYLAHVLSQMHGHQVNAETLRFILERFSSNRTHDGNFAFDQFQYYQLRDDPTLVNITESTLPSEGGHTMVAYCAEEKMEEGKTKKLIYVYDPSRPWPLNKEYYEQGDNVITIVGQGEWSFQKNDGTRSSGGSGGLGGGHILILPISVTGPLGRVPTSLGLHAGTMVTTLFVFGGEGGLEQATDADGRRLYRPGTHELDTDPATGLRNILPWFAFDGDKEKCPDPSPAMSTYFNVGDPGQSIELEISHSTGELGLRIVGQQGRVEIQGRGTAGRDIVGITGAGGPAPSVRLVGGAANTYDLLFTQERQPGERVRQFAIQNLTVPNSGAPVTLSLTEDGAALAVTSPRVPVSFNLELREQTLYGIDVLEPASFQVKAGESRLIQPDSWTELPWSALRQRVVVAEPPPP